MKILVIDDVRIMDFECEYARTIYEANVLLHGDTDWDEVWWDHDMGMDEFGNAITTRPLVEQLEKEATFSQVADMPRISKCVVHSSNGPGVDWIVAGLKNAGYDVYVTNPPVIGHINAGPLKKKKVVIVCEVCGDLPKGYEPLPDCPNPDVHINADTQGATS